MNYFHALRAACIEKPIELLGLIVSFLTLSVAVVTLVYLIIQLNGVRDTLESQAYSYIISSQLELDKVFVEHAEYRPYFQNMKPLDAIKDEDTLQKIWAIAEIKLDVIDAFHSQAEHVNWTRYSRGAWEEYHKKSFSRSPVLCEAICKDWGEYGKHIREIALPECKPRLKPRDAQDEKKGCDWVP